MAAKEDSVKRYVVRLSADERERLEALIRKGKSPAQRLLKARILLKADVSEACESGLCTSPIVPPLGYPAHSTHQQSDGACSHRLSVPCTPGSSSLRCAGLISP